MSEIVTGVEVSTSHEPVKIREEDHEGVRAVQVCVDTLSKYRQEIGRLTQVLDNLVNLANEAEAELSKTRTELASKYDLSGKWAIDFVEKEFVRVSEDAPVVP